MTKFETIKSFLVAGIGFGVFFGAFMGFFFWSVEAGVLAGVLGGLLFGGIICLFVNSKGVKEETKVKLEKDEKILKSGGANHFVGAESMGGRLYLTSKYLRFRSHSFNFSNHELKIPLKNIDNVEFYSVLGFVPNGLKISTKEQVVEKFVTWGRKAWKEEIFKIVG